MYIVSFINKYKVKFDLLYVLGFYLIVLVVFYCIALNNRLILTTPLSSAYFTTFFLCYANLECFLVYRTK